MKLKYYVFKKDTMVYVVSLDTPCVEVFDSVSEALCVMKTRNCSSVIDNNPTIFGYWKEK